jgi:hypothetical protein
MHPTKTASPYALRSSAARAAMAEEHKIDPRAVSSFDSTTLRDSYVVQTQSSNILEKKGMRNSRKNAWHVETKCGTT